MKAFSTICVALNVSIIAISFFFGLGPFHVHDFSLPTCTEPGKCLTCDAVSGTPMGHDFTDATFLVPRQCPVCQATEGLSGLESFIDTYSRIAPYRKQLNAQFDTLMESLDANILKPDTGSVRSAVQNVSGCIFEMTPYLDEMISICQMYPELERCKTIITLILSTIGALNLEDATKSTAVLSYAGQLIDVEYLFSSLDSEVSCLSQGLPEAS